MGKEVIRERMKRVRRAYLRHPPMSSRIWDFETPSYPRFNKFLTALKLFDISPLEESFGEYETCSCKFCCTKKDRLRLECVFRRLLGLEPGVRTELSMWEEGYEIY